MQVETECGQDVSSGAGTRRSARPNADRSAAVHRASPRRVPPRCIVDPAAPPVCAAKCQPGPPHRAVPRRVPPRCIGLVSQIAMPAGQQCEGWLHSSSYAGLRVLELCSTWNCGEGQTLASRDAVPNVSAAGADPDVGPLRVAMQPPPRAYRCLLDRPRPRLCTAECERPALSTEPPATTPCKMSPRPPRLCTAECERPALSTEPQRRPRARCLLDRPASARPNASGPRSP